MASSADPEDKISGFIDHTHFVCLSKRKIFLRECKLKETLLTFAVEVVTSCFGGMNIGQVRIRTNFRPSSLVLINLTLLESNSFDYSQLFSL